MVRRILAIATYEILHILRDSKLRLALSILPVAYAIIFAGVYYNKVIDEMPVAVLDQDNSPMSREIVTAFDTSEKFHVMCSVKNYNQLKRLIDKEKAVLGIVIPYDMQKKVLQGTPVQVLTVFDGCNLIYANNIRKNALNITMNLSGVLGVKTLAGTGMGLGQAIKTINPVDFRSETWYNPQINYINYLYLGFLLIIVHQIMGMGAAVAFTREREEGSSLQFAFSGVSKGEILLGKAIPYVAMGMIQFCLLFFLAEKFLQMSFNGSYGLLLIVVFLLMLAVVGMFFCLSLISRGSLLPTRLLCATSMLFFLGSGYSWPQDGMPRIIRWIMASQPLTWTFKAAREIAAKGADFNLVKPFIYTLIFLIVLFWGANYFFLALRHLRAAKEEPFLPNIET